MKTVDILENSLITSLKRIKLREEKISWDVARYVQSIVEYVDSQYMKGVDDYKPIEELLRITSPVYEECREQNQMFSNDSILIHNLEVLLIIQTNLIMNLNSRPSL